MEFEDDLLEEVTEVFVVDSPDVADPAMGEGLALLAEREGEGTVDVGEHHFSLGIRFQLHAANYY